MKMNGFSEMIGFEVIENGRGRSVIEVEIQDRHKQFKGFVHGGVIAAVSDHAGGLAGRSARPENTKTEYFTSDLNIAYMRPGLPGRLRFVAETLKSGRTLIFTQIKIYNLQPEEYLCAICQLTLCAVPSRIE